MEKQEVEKEEHSKGVRRPRTDAARRPRPQAGLASVPAPHTFLTSHPSYDSYREPPRSEHPSIAHDRSAEGRPGERYVDVMDVGEGRTDVGPDKKEYRKDDKHYSRHGSKDQHFNPTPSGRHFGRGVRVSREGYEGEGRGGRDDHRAGRDSGRTRDYESKSVREERGPRYGVNGFQDNGRESGYRGHERREEGRFGRGEDRAGIEESGRFGSRRDEYRDSSRKEKFGERRFHGKDDARQERGDWKESNVVRRPDSERGKRLEKSMKDIVDVERPVKDNIDDYLEGRVNDKNKSGRFRERDDHESGKERSQRDASEIHRSGVENHKLHPKSTERDGSEQKSGGLKKLKLKVGGVTHTFVSDSAKKAAASSGSHVPSKAREPESAGGNKRRRHRLILQEQSDDDEEFGLPPPKAPRKSDSYSPGYRGHSELKTSNGDRVNSFNRSLEHPKTISLGAESAAPAIRKSSRVPKRRVLDGDEDDVELPPRTFGSKGERPTGEDYEKEEGDAEDETSDDAGLTLGVESYEGLGDEEDDEGAVLGKRGKSHQIRQVKENAGSGVALTARQRAMQTSKDADRESAPSLIEYPEGLTNPLSRKGKNTLSEAERQVKRVEAAHRRKQQVEKAAREIQATAIQKILGQDSTRKRRENRLEKQRQDIEEEKKAAELAPSSDSIRWTLGPSGSVVSFAEDVGLPSIFSSGPLRYPPPREKCAAPTCSNAYKYRDTKSSVPLCSLQCYQAVHSALPVTSTH